MNRLNLQKRELFDIQISWQSKIDRLSLYSHEDAALTALARELVPGTTTTAVGTVNGAVGVGPFAQNGRTTEVI
jgi:hypothetical protein